MLCTPLMVYMILLGLQGVGGQSNLSRNSWEQEDNTHCPPWFCYDSISEKCECFHHPDVKVDVICTESAALLNFGSCMTYDDTKLLFWVNVCHSWSIKEMYLLWEIISNCQRISLNWMNTCVYQWTAKALYVVNVLMVLVPQCSQCHMVFNVPTILVPGMGYQYTYQTRSQTNRKGGARENYAGQWTYDIQPNAF